jgi:hypothetical protein
MKTTKTKMLTGLATLAVVGSASNLQAQSGTYTDPYPFDRSPMQHDTVSRGSYVSPLWDKFYLGFDAGVALQQDVTLSDSIGDSEKVTFDPGARLDLQFGYSFTENWAAELEFGLIVSPVKSSYVLGADYMDVDLIEFPLLVNVIYSHPLGSHFSAYAGG